jgi:hypothetical protein
MRRIPSSRFDVAPICAEGLLGSHAGADGEDRQRPEPSQLRRHSLDLIPRVERRELAAQVAGVLDVHRDVPDPSPADRRGEHLAQRALRTVALHL